MTDLLVLCLVLAGTAFFAVGSIGLLRFPDLYSRLHALTKADNLGLGLLVVGLMIDSGSLMMSLKLLLIWLLVLAASAASAHLIAQQALRGERGRATMITWLLLDLLLAGLSIGLASAALAATDLRRCVVLFIALGLLLAVIWARLRAPDLALAEAAVGAGITGVLMLSALRDLPAGEQQASGLMQGMSAQLVSLLCLVIAAVLGWSMLHALGEGDALRLSDEVADSLGVSGVSNPVTAVLLNFRAYDTLLELAVLLAAVMGIIAVGHRRPAYRAAGPLLGGLISWLAPLFLVVGAYLLWVGAHAPGGAFQAGAMLAAVAVLLRLGGTAEAGLPAASMQRWLLVAGVGTFALVGLAMTIPGETFLQYPGAHAGGLILLIEIAATLSIAVTLALAFIGGKPSSWGAQPMTPGLLYALTGIALFVLGLRGALLHRALLGRIVAINICGAGVFMMLVALAWRGESLPPDPVPHALVLTGIVVAVSATALALALARRLREPEDE